MTYILIYLQSPLQFISMDYLLVARKRYRVLFLSRQTRYGLFTCLFTPLITIFISMYYPVVTRKQYRFKYSETMFEGKNMANTSILSQPS